MSIFVVSFTNPNNEKLVASIKRHFPNDHFVISDMSQLVSFQGTAEELAAKLGITGEEKLGGVVTQVASYFGHANVAIWAWFKAKWGAA